ncbi:hypothetical protein [Kriegella aquimaris]|uniref:Uncharacterized protein n=1 Tax=Kriegella aquimaris TaxID=192904 RepID=A0A1G9YSK2_9FLAO|nr:hypothetical protein [Kriegella aquimaris]SDN12050.1 hypothetical protein SAMN04488514_12619 [Kriegella aquimaris]
MGNGSHGKHLYFKVSSVQITDSTNGSIRYVNINYVEDLGVVPTHGQGPVPKGQADAAIIAAANVNLGPTESITDITWNNYTKKS